MANNPHFSVSARNAMLDEITTTIGASGVFIIYAGGQPTDVSDALTGANTTVAYLQMSATAFGAAASGVMTANSITDDSSAVGGTAGFFSICKSTGARVADGSVDTSGADLNLNSTTITTGATVSITAFTVTIAA
jgi:hypothetical protein